MTAEEWALSSPSVSCALGDSLISERIALTALLQEALQAHMNASSAECESPHSPRGMPGEMPSAALFSDDEGSPEEGLDLQEAGAAGLFDLVQS